MEFGQLILRHEDINCITTSKELDATVIELKKECITLLDQRHAKFFKITSARININDQVAMVQYPNEIFAIDMGLIHQITASTLHYYRGGDFGSSGSPILRWNKYAIGLHFQRIDFFPTANSWLSS